MDVLKFKEDRKKRKILNRKNSRETKLNKIIKRKTKERGNHKAFNCEKGVHKLNEIRQVFKPIANKRLTAGRLKPKQTQEGMFLKGLRTQYVSRNSLNEANEARKNEDINKIIDIGGGTLDKGGRRGIQKKSSKRDTAEEKTSKLKELISIFDVREGNSDENAATDFERCPLSPISFPFQPTEVQPETETTYKREETSESSGSQSPRERNIEFDREIKKFAIDYEERVGSEILPNIPVPDVLETTIASLRKLYIKRREELEKREETEETFFDSCNHKAQSFDLPISHHSEMNYNFFTRGESLNQEEPLKFHPNISPLSSNIKFLESDHIQDNKYSLQPSFLHLFESGIDNTEPLIDPPIESTFKQREDNKRKRELEFVSPPIHFYPRNMF